MSHTNTRESNIKRLFIRTELLAINQMGKHFVVQTTRFKATPPQENSDPASTLAKTTNFL